MILYQLILLSNNSALKTIDKYYSLNQTIQINLILSFTNRQIKETIELYLYLSFILIFINMILFALILYYNIVLKMKFKCSLQWLMDFSNLVRSD